MKNIKYILLSAVLLGFTACNDEADFEDQLDNPTEEVIYPELTAGSADFSTYIAVGASFSGGFTDNALFIAGQESSFPNLLSQKFALVGGGDFTQPLMNDNIGGFVLGTTVVSDPRLYFDGSGPATLPATPTTQVTDVLTGNFNNYGIPGAKSFHLGIAGYGTLNPYFGRMASSAAATVLGDAVAQNPTFFTLSEIGGNDVLGYATSGGIGVDQTGNLDPSTYGSYDITDPNVFAASFSASVDALTANGAKGVIANLPYITSLAHFTTVPYNPLDPTDDAFGPQIPLLNSIFGALNPIFNAVDSSRAIVFSETAASPVVIKDETLTDISSIITETLVASPTFPAFIAQFGLPAEAAPLVASLLGNSYGQSRQATEDDLFVLPSSSVIGTVNEDYASALELQGLPTALAAQFATEGITLPLEDKWVLIPSEQLAIQTATDAYNTTIEAIAATKGLALVDFKSILQQASTTGFQSGNFILTTDLVTGGLISLDGVHLTSRGYALMANEMMKAIDLTYGSNFEASGNLIDAGEYPTNYPPTLQ
ncbi:SGNH/GDSL hydrolase family protein [Winogradskyella endarachnes]|uniref:G-D-S-L family lipolytic protein n=1 Tax=Winogradskyella endarachnes TaxID=2681965 RepID=A0A6L6U8Y7_9FLAO|nr:G-D-S-L family lipolytic protein [Winogradskyella endarachnes]MUU78509.1 G-D-S-L family lipolytic protein [Winogradskyella endarachnes]